MVCTYLHKTVKKVEWAIISIKKTSLSIGIYVSEKVPFAK